MMVDQRSLRLFPQLCLAAALVLGACTEQQSDAPPTDPPPTETPQDTTPKAEAPKTPFLLLSQAQFEWIQDEATGKRKPKPGPAKLVILEATKDGYTPHVLEDDESRVFHKAVCRKGDDGLELLTIGATDAHLKSWRWKDGAWAGTSHWKPSFGGKWDRLRDFEIGDVDGDGSEELVIATHDQGVVAVAKMEGGTWKPKEIAREASIFVHEIEIGDVDGDGKKEIYATPSAPNKADHSQSGKVVVFYPQDDGSYKSVDVAVMKDRHAKEILVTDVDGDGKDELYVSVEAKTKKGPGGMQILEPLEIRQYVPSKNKKKWKSKVAAVLDKGVQARVLFATQVTKDGPKGLVVTTMKDGIWWLSREGKKWGSKQIDAQSSGFEHAAAAADVDGDGSPELIVASDNDDAVRVYRAKADGSFDREDIYATAKSDLTWAIEACL